MEGGWPSRLELASAFAFAMGEVRIGGSWIWASITKMVLGSASEALHDLAILASWVLLPAEAFSKRLCVVTFVCKVRHGGFPLGFIVEHGLTSKVDSASFAFALAVVS